MSTLELFRMEDGLRATAEPNGWTLCGPSVHATQGFPNLQPQGKGTDDLARRRLETELGQLIETGIAEQVDGAVCIPWSRFGEVLADAYGVPLRGSEPSPLLLKIDSISAVSRADFRYRYQYLFGARETEVDRVGYFVRQQLTGRVFCLDERSYRIVDAMDQFNALPEAERTAPSSWLTLATVKSAASEVGAALDAALAGSDVVVPAQLGLGMHEHEDGSLSFYPTCDELSESGFRDAFFRNVDVGGIYSLDGDDGRRVRVILDERQKVVLGRMKAVRRVRGPQRKRAIENPEAFFDGLLDAVTIYGERVIGIGELPGPVMPHDPREGGGFLKPEVVIDPPPEPPPGGWIELPVDDIEQLRKLGELVDNARGEGRTEIAWNDKPLRLTPSFLRALAKALKQSREGDQEKAKGKKFLIVYTDEDELRAKDQEEVKKANAVPPTTAWVEPPKSFADPSALKAHQREALAWLHRCASLMPHRRGALLADEMGLGKTVEVLAHLARHIEQGGLRIDASCDGLQGPYRPILIVVPLMLLENGTWQQEMRRFFANDGSVFLPVLALHGREIDAVRRDGALGSETVLGQPLLDPIKLMQHRVVITNYETVVNYQHSLARLFDGKRPLWSVLVTDEAQKQKSPDTKVSAALKAIHADFKIAMTGTPVENRLLDLWNIVDYFQPALLGTKREFCSEFEEPASGPEATTALEGLRGRLLFREPHAYLLRRTTNSIVKELPARVITTVPCVMSDAERNAHLGLLSVLRDGKKKGAHLSVLQRMVRLYQHPAIDLDTMSSQNVSALVNQSSKLRAVLKVLEAIKAKGEKAIIFARHIDVQQMLSLVIAETLGVPVPIINGTTSRSEGALTTTAGTARARETRRAILDRFKATPGFGVLVLSPFVAGVGLTIVEANHVIHYGRWWNPAVEAQATARVYRLGQKRDVHVYLPVLTDPKKILSKTFDERLHDLLQSKEDLAQDFLQPPASEESCASELCDELLDDQGAGAAEARPFGREDLALLKPDDFEAAVAALFAAEGYRVVLTSRANDGGADVIAISKGLVTLVQAKHTAVGAPLDDSAVNDLLGAADIYRPRLGASALRLVVASNAPASPVLKAVAGANGVALSCGEGLVTRMLAANVGLGGMTSAASTRSQSFEDGVRRARTAMESA